MRRLARERNCITVLTTLPDCIHRGKIYGDHCECFSDRFAGPDFAIRPLRVCTHPCPFINKPNRGPARQIRRTACVYLGPILSRTDESGRPCNCPTKWTRKCEVHGECSLVPRNNTPHCQTCPDYEAR